MPYKRRKSDVNDSKVQEKKSYIIGYVKRASVTQLREINKYFMLETNSKKLPKNTAFIQERLINFVEDLRSEKTLNKLYDILPLSY
jgi:hypothetical protein